MIFRVIKDPLLFMYPSPRSYSSHNAYCELGTCLVVRRICVQVVEASNDHKRKYEKREAYL